MKTLKISILNKIFNLDVTYDCYKGEEILDSQNEALTDFMNGKPEFEKAFEAVKSYSYIHQSEKEFSIENVFDYVIPRYVFVKRNNKREIALMCDYKYDQEHGIAILFKENKYIEIMSQDSLL